MIDEEIKKIAEEAKEKAKFIIENAMFLAEAGFSSFDAINEALNRWSDLRKEKEKQND